MIWMGLLSLTAALLPLYLKYRVVWTGERCRGKIVGIAKQEAGYAVGGAAVRKNAYLVKIGQKQYYTAHGCLFPQLGRRKIGQEIWVFRNERYGREVFRCQDCRIELLSLALLAAVVFFFWMGVSQ